MQSIDTLGVRNFDKVEISAGIVWVAKTHIQNFEI